MEEKDNKYVAVAYKLYTITEGKEELLEENSEGQPFLFISNMGVNLPAFEDKLTALNAGENFDFVIPQTEAFGEYHEEAVQELDKKVFYVDGQFDYKHIREDAVVPLMNEAGERIAMDVAVGDEVYYGKFGGNEVKVDGEDYLLLRADDIYAIIED